MDNSIFNKEQKMQYIEYSKKYEQILTNYFKRLSVSEKKYNKDLLEMSEDELMDALCSLGVAKESTKSHIISHLRGYADWAVLNGKIANVSPIHRITPESIDGMAAITRKMLRDPQQVEEILSSSMRQGKYDELPNRFSRDKLVFWLLYSGLTLDEIRVLKKNNICKQEKTITTEANRKYPVDDHVIELWDQVANMDCIEKRGTRSYHNNIVYKLNDSDYLFRTIEGTNKVKRDLCLKISILMSIIQKIFAFYHEETKQDIKVAPNNIRLSGIFYRLYLMEREGQGITPEILAEYLNMPCSNKRDLSMKIRKYAIDYEDWKLAYQYM